MVNSVLETDVLIVGSGAAGLFSAVKAKESGVDVVVIEKAQSGFSGDSAYGAQHIPVLFPGDDIDKSAKQCVLWSDYLADQDIVYNVVGDSYDRFQDLVKWGVGFMKDEKGDIKTVLSDKSYSTECKARYVFPSPPGGAEHIGKIKKEALRLGVKFVDRVMITDLLQSGEKIAGAVGFNTRDGSFLQISAKSVIMATGTFALALPIVNVLKSGPAGMMMALRAGAELKNMEQGKGFNCGVSPVFTSMSPYYWAEAEWWGQKLTNADGEEFMEKYELSHKLDGRRHWPPPWRPFVLGIINEWKEGRGPCYLDLEDCPNYWERMKDLYGEYLDQFVREWDYLADKRGCMPIDEYRKQKHELVPGGAAYDAHGGIRVDTGAATAVPGLFAAGVATDSGGNAGYTTADSFIACFSQGHRAGINAAEYSKKQQRAAIDEEQVMGLKNALFAPMECKEGITAEDLQAKLAVISYRYLDIVKTEERLKKGIAEIEKLKLESKNLVAKDPRQLRKCHNAKSTLELWEIMAKTSLMRTESRADHYREDYPLMDNENWLKWLIVTSEDGELKIDLEDIPFEEKGWKHRPEPGKIDQMRRRK